MGMKEIFLIDEAPKFIRPPESQHSKT